MSSKAESRRMFRKRVLLTLEFLVWLVFTMYAINFVTSQHSSSLHPNWFRGDKNNICTSYIRPDLSTETTGCGESLVGYSDNGFPIAIPGQATSGRYGLAKAINYGTAAAASLLLAAALLHRRGYNLILSPAYKR